MIQEGGAEVNLIRLGNKASIDDKLASLITYVQRHPHVVRVELQAREIFTESDLSFYLADNCRTQDSARYLQRNSQTAECNDQAVARAAYSDSRIDMNRFGRL